MTGFIPDNDYRDFDRDSRRVGLRLGGWIILATVFVVLLGLGLWGFGVISSPIKGQGDAFKTKESGTNRIRAQEEFVQTYNDLLAADRRVDAMWQAKKDDPTQVNRTNYTGAVNFCIQLVADYDALGAKYTSADYRPADLPAQIDPLDRTTDCKENTK